MSVLLAVIWSQFLDGMNDQSVQYFANGGNVALQEDCHRRPLVDIGHLRHLGIELLGQNLNP